jgi:hypothetical protein
MYLVALPMNIIPLISLRTGRILDGRQGNPLSIDDLFKRVEKDSMLYVLDYDGIERNNPNLDLYQRLTEHCTLWIDNGPRQIDDVMDTIMAGATNITLREELWPEMDLPGVFELTDDEVFVVLDTTETQQPFVIPSLQKDVGAVVFHQTPQAKDGFTTLSHLKDLAVQHKIYLYINELHMQENWESREITGVILDTSKTMRKQNGL